MKILHTADWHIGKKLHNFDLSEDFDQFVHWLKKCLQKEEIDVLIVSGDIFDLANPSSSSRNQYYKSLVVLKKHVRYIILTGGNHDSPAMLNAPQELMREFGLDVIGGLPEQIAEALIPIRNENGEIEIVVAALPFLRNSDLRKETAVLKTYEDRLAALRKGISAVFYNAAQECKANYPGIPAIAMGHLFAAGMESSDSERDIQIGNQASFQASAFDEYFNYVALGHIHKPQRVAAKIPVFYSGSPIPLSFSERKNEKRVLLLDTEKGWEPRSIRVPSFRKLLKIEGTIDQLIMKLNSLPKNEKMTHLIEVELQEEYYQAKRIQDLESLVADFMQPGYQIVKYRANFVNQERGAGEYFEESESLEELKPENVFRELLRENDYTQEEHQEVYHAFLELLEETRTLDL